MEVVIALVLFAALIACWLVLPSSTTTAIASADTEPAEASGFGRTTVGQRA